MSHPELLTLPTDLLKIVITFVRTDDPRLLIPVVYSCKRLKAVIGDPSANTNVNKRSVYYDFTAVLAERGYINVIKWARAHQFPWSELAFTSAARYNKLETLKYLKENNCPLAAASVCMLAASNNNLEILRWGLDNGCKMSAAVYNMAAYKGSLDVLQWLHENEPEKHRPREVVVISVLHKHWKVVKWAIEKGYPHEERDKETLAAAEKELKNAPAAMQS